MSTKRHRSTAPVASRAVRVRFANRARMLATLVSRRTPHFRGKERVVRAYDRCLREVAAAGRELRLTVNGVAFALDTEDIIDFRIAYLSGHDRTVVGCLDAVVRGRPAVLWDVGANVGSISLPLARRHPDLVVEAFEPSPVVVARMRRNLALNDRLAARIRLHDIALCDRVGSVEFFPSAEPGNSGVGTLMPSTNTEATPLRVAARTGDTLIAAGTARPPDIIKIDVEGFEYEVLCGLRLHLARRPDLAVVFEHEPYRLRDRKEPGAATELLTSLGFTLFGLPQRGATLTPFQPSMLERHIDILACGPGAARETWA